LWKPGHMVSILRKKFAFTGHEIKQLLRLHGVASRP
jgi:hypothetical protein